MFRFFMPQAPDPAERIHLLNSQFDEFLHSDALQELSSLDVVGLFTGDTISAPDQYDPFQLLQDLIGILDWIDRFRGISVPSV